MHAETGSEWASEGVHVVMDWDNQLCMLQGSGIK